MKGHEEHESFALGRLNKEQKSANLRPVLRPVHVCAAAACAWHCASAEVTGISFSRILISSCSVFSYRKSISDTTIPRVQRTNGRSCCRSGELGLRMRHILIIKEFSVGERSHIIILTQLGDFARLLYFLQYYEDLNVGD